MSDTKNFEVKTAAHARFLRDAAIKRADKARAAAAEADAKAIEYDNLANTLPDGASVGSSVPEQYLILPAGSVVRFRYGRGDNVCTKVGSITATLQNEAGKAKQYKVRTGEGFNEVLLAIFPGQIVGLGNEAAV